MINMHMHAWTEDTLPLVDVLCANEKLMNFRSSRALLLYYLYVSNLSADLK